ncbi:endonuclease/exonuclease/phosphatase family protein [Leptothrix sp. BB-4]
MRVIHLNLCDGCTGDPGRLDRIGAWLAGQHADVVTFNELNGWQQPDVGGGRLIDAIARRWGWPESRIGAVPHSDYPVGVMSHRPIEAAETVGAPFHHSLLQLRIGGLHVWVAHLTPVDAVRRLDEARWIARAATALQAPLLLIGDLNTLTPLDEPAHRHAGLRDRLQADAALRRKFLRPDGEIDTAPMQALHAAGLVELRAPGIDQTSVPTPWNRDAAHAAPMRLDHALANAALLGRRPRAHIADGPDTAMLSDHRPVIVEID